MGAAALCLTLLTVLWAPGVLAGTLQLDRTRIELSARKSVSEFSIANVGPQPSLIQTRVFRWTQDGEQNHLTPSDDLLVSPPIAEILPGESQLLRVGLLATPESGVETSYRLIVQEVPRPEDAEEGNTVSVLLRISFPVFVQPTTTVSPELEWRAARTSTDRIQLTLSNTGTAHAKVQDVELALPDGTVVAKLDSIVAYVLPGETRSWDVGTDAPFAGERLRLSAGTQLGRVHADLDLGG